MDKFLTKNPIISNRTTVGYYGIKPDPGRRTNLHLTGDLLDIEVDLEIEIDVEMRIWIGGGKREVGDSDVFKTPEPPPTVT